MLAGAKIVWVFAIFHKSWCDLSLWPKWLRPRGEVVVYSQPGETPCGEQPPSWWREGAKRGMPCIVLDLQVDAGLSKQGFDLPR
jgi:hypothetical protein